MFREWLHNWQVWWWVQKYLSYSNQLEEWELRYVADTPETERKQYMNMLRCEAKMQQALDKLRSINFTEDVWVYIGEGEEAKLSDDSVEVRWV